LLQSAYSNYQIGAFENFHQLVEDALIVLGPRLQHELRFANRMKRRLLISHRFLLTKQIAGHRRRRKIKPPPANIPVFLEGIPSIFVSIGNLKLRRARRCWRGGGDQGERR
jgi:hypothetical protein